MYSYWIQILFLILFKIANSHQNEVSSAQIPQSSEAQEKIYQRLSHIEERLEKLEQKSQNASLPKNCQEIKNSGVNTSGVYTVNPGYGYGFMVVCDMETQGGGWAYLLNRFDGSQNFYRGWLDYKWGFGDFLGEFWLGLEHLYQLTGLEVNELLVELTDWDNETAFAHYDAFSVGGFGEGYSLKILGGYSGDAGDSLKYSLGCRFSTKDHD